MAAKYLQNKITFYFRDTFNKIFKEKPHLLNPLRANPSKW